MLRCAIGGPDCLGYVSVHHLLEKSIYPEFRNEPLNLIPLCTNHHTMSNELAPHSMNWSAQLNFNLYIERYFPERWAWMVENRRRMPELPQEDERIDRKKGSIDG